jgi:hypothetical protein
MEPAFAIHKTFRPGTLVPLTGIYFSQHAAEHCSRSEVVLMRDRIFPQCETCGHAVAFRLLRAAPYIGDDADFAGGAGHVGITHPRRARIAHAR